MMAALRGLTDIVKLLMAYGVNSALSDKAGNAAVSLVRRQDDAEMAALPGGA